MITPSPHLNEHLIVSGSAVVMVKRWTERVGWRREWLEKWIRVIQKWHKIVILSETESREKG